MVLQQLCDMIGLKRRATFSSNQKQNEAKPTLIVTRSRAFSRALHQLQVIRVLIGSLEC